MRPISSHRLISLSTDERDFILELCENTLEIDLSVKLRLAKVNPQGSITAPISPGELSCLITVLHRKSENKVISFNARDWAGYLADKLVGQSSGVATV